MRLDDYLIDQVCQPAVDKLPGAPAPALIARHMILAGAALCSIAMVLIWQSGVPFWGMGFGIASIVTSIGKSFEVGSGLAGAGVAPVSRLRDRFTRMLNLALLSVLVLNLGFLSVLVGSVVALAAAILTLSPLVLLTVSQALLTIGLYVAACRRPPPGAKAAVPRRHATAAPAASTG